jgi:hypothetical protein
MKTEVAGHIESNFNLKNLNIALVPSARSADRAVMSIRDLEALRVDQRSVPASKHGLETICGASCETGAQ